MIVDGDSEAEFDTLKNGSTDTAAVEAYYNDWSARYDKELADWDYTAPDVAAAMLTEHLQPLQHQDQRISTVCRRENLPFR